MSPWGIGSNGIDEGSAHFRLRLEPGVDQTLFLAVLAEQGEVRARPVSYEVAAEAARKEMAPRATLDVVTTSNEQFNDWLNRSAADLRMMLMIETPAAVFAIEDIAREVDFLSVGTNDLTQFTLAADRLRVDDEDCAVHHPSMLKALAQVVRAAQASSRPLSVCGEAAGDPATACLLVGLGVRELSMSPARAAGVRYALLKIRAADARALADCALQTMDPQQVRRALNAFPFARPGEVMPPPEEREVEQ